MTTLTSNYNISLRPVTSAEIDVMTAGGCTAKSWSDVTVANGFDARRCRNVHFIGRVAIGSMEGDVVTASGVSLPAGIYDATLIDCSVGNNVRISSIKEAIMRYDIADGCAITNVGAIVATDGATFGNGTAVSVLDETGSRSVSIYEGLSAQIAYFMAMYRHDVKLISALTAMIDRKTADTATRRGSIDTGVVIANVGSVENVIFRADCRVVGASSLTNGTIGRESYVGYNVVADGFIMASGANVDSGAVLKRVYLGQASHLGLGFVAHDSLIFANCVLECGEAAAIFAGPHTTSMHKSTLLIGALLSFFNAGSGTNQSNHLYKTGPVHHGIFERGCKTSSSAYVMWPARIGMFTLISGRITSHPDTSVLPYSYLLESDGNSMVVPGANIFAAGTVRDLLKWSARDRRPQHFPALDIITYDCSSPLSAQAMLDAIDFIEQYEASTGVATRRGFRMMEGTASRGKRRYQDAIRFHVAMTLARHISSGGCIDCEAIDEQAIRWIDVAGMVADKADIDSLCKRIGDGVIDSLEAIGDELRRIDDAYQCKSLNYACRCMSDMPDGSALDNNAAIAKLIEEWSITLPKVASMLQSDIAKDFGQMAAVSAGIDGERMADFDAARGPVDRSSAMLAINDLFTRLDAEAARALARLK